MTDQPDRLDRVEAALARMGNVLDELQARKSDADVGHALKAGKGVLVPLVSVVVAVFSAFFLVEARATSIAKHQIDSGATRAQVAAQVSAQVQFHASREDIVRLEGKVDGLVRELRIDDRLSRVEKLLNERLPTKGRVR